jgi:carbon-monoxide dehydrogenase large subunit
MKPALPRSSANGWGSIPNKSDLSPATPTACRRAELSIGAIDAAGGVGDGQGPDEIVEKGRRIAAALIEVAEQDVEFAHPRFVVKGTDRSMGLFEAAAAGLGNDLPADLRGPLMGICDQVMSVPSFAYTCAVCEVEVDPETGVVEIARYTSIDDCGRAVNPMLIHGQSHGGIAQGIGQALWEECFYDRGTAQLLSGSLMDYALPRADNLPLFQTEISKVPSTTTQLVRPGCDDEMSQSQPTLIRPVV